MRTQSIAVGTDRFDVDVDGPEDAPAVFLLHGWPQTPRCWSSMVPTLLEGGRRVVAPRSAPLLLARGGAPLRSILLGSGLDADHARSYTEGHGRSRHAGGGAALVPGGGAGGGCPGRRSGHGPHPGGVGQRDTSMSRAAVEGSGADVDARFRFVSLEGRSHWLPERHAADVLPPLIEHLA